jgi:hypothetical protein
MFSVEIDPKRVVVMYSNYHNICFQQNMDLVYQPLPEEIELLMKLFVNQNVVTNYNKYMGGVDRSDQMISYTNNVVKSFKWWKKF